MDGWTKLVSIFDSSYGNLGILLTMVGGAGVAIVYQALKDRIAEMLKGVLKGIVLKSVLFFILPLLYCLLNQYVFTAVFILIAFLVLIGLYYARKNETGWKGWVLCLQAMAFLGAFYAEDRYIEWVKVREDNKVHAYFVFPFKKNDIETTGELRDIWDIYRRVITETFSNDILTSVKAHVLPSDLDDEEFATVLSRPISNLNKKQRFSLDVIFRNRANLDKKNHQVVLSTRLSFYARPEETHRYALPVRKGSENDIEYFALQTAVELLYYLRRFPELKLPEQDETNIKKRILEKFEAFLRLSFSTDGSIFPAIRTALNADRITDSEMEAILDHYAVTFDEDKNNRLLTRNREAVSAKVTSEQ